ncbi:MAG: OmpA family protein [Rickettsiales bacterium]|nr:OmpA family protein [Rickettsiales bacterium]
MKRLIALLATTTLLTACQQVSDSYDNNGQTFNGAAIGAIAGAALGSLTGDGSTERRQRATIGALAGAAAGAGIGQYMDRQEDQLRGQLAGSGVDVKRQGDDILLNMPSSITFAVDQSNIQSQFYGTLSNVASVLKSYPETTINVIGHTDSSGAADYNQSLSERRAQSVVQYLGGQGVAYARLDAYGQGESQPIASNNTLSGKAQNRRVEVRIIPQAQ